MTWFEINCNHIISKDYNPWSADNGAVWGLYIGGRWCLDYTWKLVFGISTEDWNNRCSNIKSHKDFYDFCEWLGVNYKKDGIIYKRGEKYDDFGKKNRIKKNTNMKKGIELIAEERQRQIDVEGYSEQHDSQHNASELIYAAIAYVESAKVGVNCSEMGNTDENEIMRRKTEIGIYDPFGWSFKPSTDIRDLVKAGALIAAAIDRLESTNI